MLHRRLLRLETVNGRHTLRHLTDAELDARLRAELAQWLRDDHAAVLVEVRGELDAFLAVAARAHARVDTKNSGADAGSLSA